MIDLSKLMLKSSENSKINESTFFLIFASATIFKKCCISDEIQPDVSCISVFWPERYFYLTEILRTVTSMFKNIIYTVISVIPHLKACKSRKTIISKADNLYSLASLMWRLISCYLVPKYLWSLLLKYWINF